MFKNQRTRIIDKLMNTAMTEKDGVMTGEWISVSSLMRLGIACYTARIHEINKLTPKTGVRIENRNRWIKKSQIPMWKKILGIARLRYSEYRIVINL